jgi:hypothetical protein
MTRKPKLSRAQALRILTDHNKWRRFGKITQRDPSDVGHAIDFAIDALKPKRKRARKVTALHPRK